MKLLDKETISVGVLGLGFGIVHVRELSKNPGSMRLKKVCDLDDARLERAKTELAGKDVCFTKNYREILDDPEIDVVCISLPHHLHRRFVEEAAAAGKHIMLDKPMARTEQEGLAIAEAVKKADVQFMVAFNFRFHPMYQAIRENIADGAIGLPLLVITRHDQRFFYPGGSNWRNSESVGGGAVIGSGVHNIDFMRFCLGDPEEVYACGVNDAQRLDAEAGAAIIYRYASGTIVNFFCNWCKSSNREVPSPSHPNLFGEWEFYGREGELRKLMDGGLCVSKLDSSVRELTFGNDSAFYNLWTHFEDCLRTGKTPLTNVDEALRTQHLIEITYEAMKSGKPVRF